MKTIIKSCITLTLVASTLGMNAQTGNHVFSGAEAANFGTIDLATPPGTTWSTYRGAVPGYFSAVGTATYINANDMHNVDGYVKHYANAADQTYNFPVGTGTDYRSLAISGNIPATAVIATAWIAGDPTSTEDPTSTGAASGMHPITSSSVHR